MNTVAWERTVEESRIKESFYFSITSAKKLIKFISIKLFDRQLRFQFLRTATSKVYTTHDASINGIDDTM